MDGCLDGSTDDYAGCIEVIEGRDGRRLRTEQERARIAAESLVPGAKVADVARRHSVTRWQVYDWRKRLAAGKLAVSADTMAEPAFAALVVETPPPAAAPPKYRGTKAPGRIELEVDGVTVRIGADVDEARGQFSVRAMCRCLRIQPSGFYAWLKAPLSKRAREDERQTELLKEAWVESGKVYGQRKLHDDLVEQGESICLNRVSRLTKLAGIKAQIGYKRRPGKYGGKPSTVVDNTLDQQFDVEAPDTVWDEALFAIGSRTMAE